MPRDVGTVESIVGNVLLHIEEQQEAYQKFYHGYLGLFHTQNVITVKFLQLTNVFLFIFSMSHQLNCVCHLILKLIICFYLI